MNRVEIKMIKPIYIVVGGVTAIAVVLISTLIPTKSKASSTTTTKDAPKESPKTTPTPEPTPAPPKPKEVLSYSPPSPAPAPAKSTPKGGTDRPKSSYEALKEGTSDEGDWYDVITGRLIETNKEHSRVGDWGTRNRALAHMNSVVVGRKLGIV
jgi:hypothetical protein